VRSRCPFVFSCALIAGIAAVFTCSNPVEKPEGKPRLSPVSDTTVSVKDSLFLAVASLAGSERASTYKWRLDNQTVTLDSDSVCVFFFGIADTGSHAILITGIGKSGLESEAETVTVNVLLNPPSFHMLTSDTAIFANDSCIIRARGTDANGAVIRYLWSVDSAGYTASTESATFTTFWGKNGGRHVVRGRAMDNDSLLSAPDSVIVTTKLDNPALMTMADTSIAINDTLVLRAARTDTFAAPVRYVWAKNGADFSDTTAADSLPAVFGRLQAGTRVVAVKAVNSHGLESDVDTVKVTVLLHAPALSIIHDTAVAINDTIVLHATATDTNGRIVSYVWALAGNAFLDTTKTGSILLRFTRADTGNHVIKVKAFDDDTLPSNTDSINLVVRMKPPPSVRCMEDTGVFINDSVIVHAAGTMSGSKSPIVAYVWAKDGGAFIDTTETESLALRFARSGTGRHTIKVKAVDRDTMESLPDSMIVTVLLGAPGVRAMKDTAVFINDTVLLHAAGADTNGRVIAYVWSIDGGAFRDTSTGAYAMVWGRAGVGTHRLKVKAIDDDTVESLPDSTIVTVTSGAPRVAAMNDTVVFINDTAALHASGTDTNGTIVAYAWSIDGGARRDTTASGALKTAWGRNKAGTHLVTVTAIDNDSLSSAPDSVTVTVLPGAPRVKAMKDTAVFINDTVPLRAAGTDTNGRVTAYVWSIDGGAYRDTSAGAFSTVWGRAGAGTHRVKVKAIDDDTVESAPDSMIVTVRIGMPVVAHLRDTSIVRGDTVMETIAASDTNGTIKKYYWDIGGKGWSDSSDSPSRPISTNIHTVLMVVAGARDDDGNIATDTFTVSFSAVPCSLTISRPRWRDTVYVHAVDLPLGRAAFSYSARRKDAVADSFTYFISCGKSAAELVPRYSGTDTAPPVLAFDTGKGYFRLIAVSSHNDSVQVMDSVFAVWQRQVCFIGHSIITGAGGTTDSGGFRRMVIDTLRSLCPSKKLLRVAGPFTSNMLQPPQDDSCLAKVGKTAVEIFDSLFYYPSLAADAWVYMMGANDRYSYYGWYYTVATIDFMHSRNPKSEIYVLSPLPLPHDTTNASYTIDSLFRADLVTFNHRLDSAVTVRRQAWLGRQDGGVWMVDVYSPMALLPDSVYNPVYFDDLIHPNQKGYTLMGKRVIQTIKANTKIFK
jgi:hypothetical protein